MKEDFPKRNWKRLIMAAVVIILVWLGATYIPWREERWKKDGTLYVIEKNLWNTPVEMWLIFDEGGSVHGPISESRKWHGKWSQLSGGRLAYHWYWYGEEVTEGRWHELNR